MNCTFGLRISGVRTPILVEEMASIEARRKGWQRRGRDDVQQGLRIVGRREKVGLDIYSGASHLLANGHHCNGPCSSHTCANSNMSLLTQENDISIDVLRSQIKAWENSFVSENGRKPERADIKQDAIIGELLTRRRGGGRLLTCNT
jgi:hypothetical protein